MFLIVVTNNREKPDPGCLKHGLMVFQHEKTLENHDCPIETMVLWH